MIYRPIPASHPPSGLEGWDSSWSRLVSASDADGQVRTWHVLDNGVVDPIGTLLCVHGNPSWSYMWRKLASTSTRWRVVAADSLNMGFSERVGSPRRLAGHIADLRALTAAMGIGGPVVTVAHDWGGPISLGWALENLHQLAGVVLVNTAVARPVGVRVPPLIRLVRTRATEHASCVATPAFLNGTLRLAHPSLSKTVREGYRAPYSSPARRSGIGDFVADIPVEAEHPTHVILDGIAGQMSQLAEVPSLLLWGARDPVFSTAFLADLQERLPHAAVHRYPDAGHLVMEDTEGAGAILDWLESSAPSRPTDHSGLAVDDSRRMWSALETRSDDDAVAVAEMDPNGSGQVSRSVTFGELDERVRLLADRLTGIGVKPGDRVAPLIPPGIDLVELVYASWRAGAVVVAADAALGIGGVGRALRSARPEWVVGDWRGLSLARSLRLDAKVVSVETLPAAAQRILNVAASLGGPADLDVDEQSRVDPGPDDPAVVVFTSGSTGTSKGVIYRHGQLEAQRDALASTYSVTPSDRLVAAFAPFAILGPALGITSVVPAMKVTSPGSLDARAFANAARAIEATMTFASPAALANVVATIDELDDSQRVALGHIRAVASAGAPISPNLLRTVGRHFVNAAISTPYGMTEVMPVTNISLEDIEAAGPGNGVCVGKPIRSVELAVSAIDALGRSSWEFVEQAGVTGEICVRAPHASDGYDGLWATQNATWQQGWHRTGDVGHIDDAGRLWVEGRVSHLILTAHGWLTPVGIEHDAESLDGVRQAAAVGVGPVGTQQLVVVVSLAPDDSNEASGVVADERLAAAVREAVGVEVAAVLVSKSLPVDRRHNSKIERLRIAGWAESVLAGRKVRRL